MEASVPDSWRCPVCGRRSGRVQWQVTGGEGECGVAAAAFRPSSDTYGQTAAPVVRCLECGHGSLAWLPEERAVDEAYAEAADPVSLREEAGQVETARRGLRRVERVVRPATLADVGCWTGSFLVAARERGWETWGVDPSRWAVERGRKKGLRVWEGDLYDQDLANRSYRTVAMCDVLEHLADPAAAIQTLSKLVEPGGVLYLTLPDAGSLIPRLLGRRWWSVLPMHLQYFTRGSIRRLIQDAGFSIWSIRTHSKAFSARYYAERLGGYSPSLQRAAVRALQMSHQDHRLVSPNFGDRMEVIATR
jgi:SAM-dependent methyltransferase